MKKIIFKRLLFLLLIILPVLISAQNKVVTKILPVVRVQNDAFFKVLDSIIEFEKSCSYYSLNLNFSISIEQYDTNSICIQSSDNVKVFFRDTYGVFIYKNYNFFVFQKEPTSLFSKVQNEFIQFKYKLYNKDFIVLDDSHTQWLFTKSKDEFILNRKSGSCVNKNGNAP
jgi:hypothetical protein